MLREKPWDKNLQLLLVSIIAFNVIPHVTSIPIWATAVAAVFLSWKYLTLLRGVPRPPRWLLWGTSVACSVGVFAEYQTILGQEAASTLLVTLASAKLLETNRYRDAMFVIFTSFFLLMAHLLDSQTILTTIFMAVDVLLITTLMFQLHKQERRHSARSFRPVMRTLALAIPVWIFLFIVFPRFSAGFWGAKDSRASGGFAEELDPGGIESLVESEETAFRVKFNGPVPHMGELYCGAVLTEANGLIWMKSKEKTPANDVWVPSPKLPPQASYKTYLEPRFQPWIYTLDYPETLVPSQVGAAAFRRRPGFVFENMRPNGGITVYDATSHNSSPLQHLLKEDRDHLLKLPDDLDPRIRALASQFAAEAARAPSSPAYPTLADRIGDHTMDWFVREKFGYTKSPGALHRGTGSSQLAEFLFMTKRGFCEHYAAAFATLMRAAGVPARVTMGFMGASRNEYGDYFVVRDLDAHAWTEIWRDEPGRPGVGRWVRVDPTSYIAPLRLEMGGDFNLLDPASLSQALTAAEAKARLGLRNTRLYYKVMAAWDNVQMQWNSFLSDYNFEFQKAFLESLGLKNITRWALFGYAAIGVLIFALGLSIFLRRRAHQVEPILIAWRDLGRKLERAGIARRPNEGPLDFTRRAGSKLPHIAAELETLGSRYAELRYGPAGPSQLAREFRRAVRGLSLKPKS